MKKARVYKRKNIKGWWVGWYEGGKKKAKALPSRALAKHFCQIKYTRLNSDVFTGVVNADWHQMVEEYRQAKQVKGLREASIYEAMLTLGHFERLMGPDSSKWINQNALDKFILDRGNEVKKMTLNKDIRNEWHEDKLWHSHFNRTFRISCLGRVNRWWGLGLRLTARGSTR